MHGLCRNGGCLQQIVPKGHRSNESYAPENTSRDKDRASVSKGVDQEPKPCLVIASEKPTLSFPNPGLVRNYFINSLSKIPTIEVS
jgi:hypothetical protein